MRTHSLAVACGTILSVMAVGQALGQQEQPGKTPRQPDRTTPTTPKYRSTTGQQMAPSILRDMEGVWRVEVQCGAAFSGLEHGKQGGDVRMKGTEPSRTNEPDRSPDATKRDNENRTPGQPSSENDRDNPNHIKDPLQRSQPGEGAGLTGAKTYVGYAETQLVLGDNILQQRIVIPEMMRMGAGPMGVKMGSNENSTNSNNVGNGNNTTNPNKANNPDNRDDRDIASRGSAIGANSDEMFRGLSYISFDEGSQRYHCVFMDSRSGSMHCDSGTYNESAKRLEFNGKAGNRTGTDMNNKGMEHDENVRVVVELLSPSQYRVTMYDANATGTSEHPVVKSPTIPPTENTPPPDLNKPNNNKNNNTINNTMNENEGAIIYRATFTKAASDDAPKFRRLIQEPGTPGAQEMKKSDR